MAGDPPCPICGRCDCNGGHAAFYQPATFTISRPTPVAYSDTRFCYGRCKHQEELERVKKQLLVAHREIQDLRRRNHKRR